MKNNFKKIADSFTGRVFKLVLCRLSPSNHRVIILAHHLVIDGISSRVIIEDVTKLYDLLANNAPLALPAKTNSYPQWVEKLLTFAESSELVDEEDYWRDVSSTGKLFILSNC